MAYSYPAYDATNSYSKPPRLLFDEKGNDHLILLPSPATLESEQVWDINLATKATNVLASIQKPGVKITAVQAKQGPNGAMGVTFEVAPQSGMPKATVHFMRTAPGKMWVSPTTLPRRNSFTKILAL